MHADQVTSNHQISLEDRRLWIALAASFCLLFMAGVATVFLSVRAADSDYWVAHTIEVRHQNTLLLNAVQEAESYERAFLITEAPQYRERFEQVVASIPQLEEVLRKSVADNSAQETRLTALEEAIDAKLDELEQTLKLVAENRRSEAVDAVRRHVLEDLMVKVRAESNNFDQGEFGLLQERRQSAERDRRLLLGTNIIALLAAAGLALVVTRSTWSHMRTLREQNYALVAEIQQRASAEAQLRQAQKMEALGRLTGGVAHDFNNMLAIIVGSLDLLRRRMADSETRHRRLVESALEGANRAASLTQRLLAFSRLQPLEPKPTDINKCVRDMSEMLRRTLGETIQVETVLGGGVWNAYIDCPQLESAILNLAVNARDAMPGGGKLTLETANTYLDQAYASRHVEVKPGQYVLVAITDTGTGMPPEVLTKAFEPFFTTKPTGTGTGLGLSQVHGFIKQSGGHINIYSEIGVGTTIKLYLPRHEGVVPEVEYTRTPQRGRTASAVTVLVVEDEDGVRAFTVEALQELGYRVLDADSASSALGLLDRHPEVSILLTDIVMPEVNGRQLVDRAMQRRPDLKVVYMTGYTRNAIVHNGVLDAGINLITKPFTLTQLDNELRTVLETFDRPAGSLVGKSGHDPAKS